MQKTLFVFWYIPAPVAGAILPYDLALMPGDSNADTRLNTADILLLEIPAAGNFHLWRRRDVTFAVCPGRGKL